MIDAHVALLIADKHRYPIQLPCRSTQLWSPQCHLGCWFGMLFRSNLQNRNTVSSLDSNSEGVHTFITLPCIVYQSVNVNVIEHDIHTSTKEREAMLGRYRVVRKVTTNAGNLGIRKTYSQADYRLWKSWSMRLLFCFQRRECQPTSSQTIPQPNSFFRILVQLKYWIKEAIPYTANYFELLKNEDYISRASIEAEIW